MNQHIILVVILVRVCSLVPLEISIIMKSDPRTSEPINIRLFGVTIRPILQLSKPN